MTKQLHELIQMILYTIGIQDKELNSLKQEIKLLKENFKLN